MTFDIEADWTLNLFCNYDCEYCFSRSDTEHSWWDTSRGTIPGLLQPHGKNLALPFDRRRAILSIGFRLLCQALTSTHYISHQFQLSARSGCATLPAKIDPARVQCVHGACMWGSAIGEKAGESAGHVKCLLERNFPVLGSLVMTLEAFAEFPRVAESFSDLGVPLIPKAIRGLHQGAVSRKAYTEAEAYPIPSFSEQAAIVAKNSIWQPDRPPSILFLTGSIWTVSRSRITMFPPETYLFPSAYERENLPLAARRQCSATFFERGSTLVFENRPGDDGTVP